MKYLSVCSGIEAASVAWEPLGWKPVLFSEIEAFPRAVLKRRQRAVDASESGAARRGVPLWGDFTALRPRHFARLGIDLPDLLVGGTPCQAFSVAGLRRSLDDDRGNLTLSFVRLANAIDNVRAQSGAPPLVIAWENVPGVLSTKDNAFGCFLAALVGSDAPLVPGKGQKWRNAGVVIGPRRSAAWRILDAQFFGVAQRRRRVFVVASAREDFDPASVLLEPEGVRGDSPAGRESGAVVAALTSTGVGTCGADDNQGQAGHLIPCHTTGAGFWQEGFGTLRAREQQDSHENLVCMATGQGSAEIVSDGDPSLTCNHEAPIVAFSCKDHGADAGPISPTLRSMGHDGSHANGGGQVAVALPVVFNLRGREGGAMPEVDPEGVASLRAASGGSSRSYVATSAVRRLTPRECERLQGFPDDYTLIPWKSKRSDLEDYQATLSYLLAGGISLGEVFDLVNTPDGPRYKALGNSMAVPVMHWLGVRIQMVLEFFGRASR